MSSQPNFLFIITDQHRADHLGCYGNPIVKTPNIDSLAAKGRQFDRFYVANPVCMANRASIMTGRLPSLHGVRHNGIPLSRDHTTFVDLLRDAGYATGLVGKSHLQNFTRIPASIRYEPQDGMHAPDPSLRDADKRSRNSADYEYENTPDWDRPIAERIEGDFYGFEHVEVVTGHADRAAGDYRLWAKQQNPNFDNLLGPDNALPDNRINAPQAWRTAVPEELYSTSWVAQQSEKFLAESAKQDKPFFLQMSFPDPHHPFTPPGRYWDMYDPQDIPLPSSFGKGDLPPIRAMRDALAQGTATRDSQSPFVVSEDEARAITALTYGSITMVDDAIGRVLGRLKSLGLDDNTIVIFTSDHGDHMGDHGLMLKVLLHYQGLIRVPFIWSDPSSNGNAVREKGLASSLDISATILARAGIQPYNGIQGRDLFSTESPKALLIEEDTQRAMTGFERPQRVRTLVTDRYRMSLHHGETWSELYDLENDPEELTNLFDDPSAAELRNALTMTMLDRMIDFQDRSPLPAFLA